MHVFVTGGSGLTGPAVVTELINAGHAVTGLARSEEAVARLRALGAATHAGSLDDLDSLRAGAAAADGVVHLAFGGDFADPHALVRRDTEAINALGEGLLGSSAPDRPILMTSGTFAMRAGALSTEQDPADGNALAWFRVPGERACLAFAERGLRPGAVRLAPTVHGPGDYGFIPMMIAAARRTGIAGYDPFMATAYGTDAPASSQWTRVTLSWEPTHPTLLDELRDGDYFTEPEQSRSHT